MDGENLIHIIEEIKDDNERSFRLLFEHYYPRILRVACYRVKNEELAQEVVMDVFTKLWKYRKKLSEIHNFTNYIFTAVKNQSINYIKKNKVLIESLDDHQSSCLIEYVEPEKLFLGRELAKEIETAVSNLPPRCQLIFRMVREDGLKYKEVADTLGISLKAVENQLLIAMKRIRKVVTDYSENASQNRTAAKLSLPIIFLTISGLL
jgi:RNA polymerase sigma-70 factor (ECF subfamily)